MQLAPTPSLQTLRQLQLIKWKRISAVLLLALLSLTLQHGYAQKGRLKFKGVIQNVDEDLGRSLVTLYKIQERANTRPSILGQYVVAGTNWFVTNMDLGKNYMLEVSSNNGTNKRFLIITKMPKKHARRIERMEMLIDMSITVPKELTPQAAACISYSYADEGFIQREATASEKLKLVGHPEAGKAIVQTRIQKKRKPVFD